MRRADRLFRIVQILRSRSVVTARTLATELEVSMRTIYRDVQDLIASGVPIEGEAGVGYALHSSFDLPPLMFSQGEIEALVLGARMVESWADSALAREARSILSKVATVVPERLRSRLESVELHAPGFHVAESITANLEPLRNGITGRRKVRLIYANREGVETDRCVWPLGLFYWGKSWTLVAWCELRTDFRSFRPDRIRALTLLEDRFEDQPGRDLATFLEFYKDAERRAPNWSILGPGH